MQVRAGVLYEIDLTDVPWISVILDPKQVVTTAYALARLSFVIDWFINVGGTLKAWAPAIGVNELSAWVTVEVTNTIAGNASKSMQNNDSWISSGNVSASFNLMKREKYRVPIDRSDLAIFPRINLDLNLDKIFALVLLFAKSK